MNLKYRKSGHQVTLHWQHQPSTKRVFQKLNDPLHLTVQFYRKDNRKCGFGSEVLLWSFGIGKKIARIIGYRYIILYAKGEVIHLIRRILSFTLAFDSCCVDTITRN
ncbi:MAG: hypothetical protein WAK17_17805 [Candidatus Nitrosopolaris sp.]